MDDPVELRAFDALARHAFPMGLHFAWKRAGQIAKGDAEVQEWLEARLSFLEQQSV